MSAPPAEAFATVLAECKAPSLLALMAHAQCVKEEAHQDPWQRSLPHERWLMAQAGVATNGLGKGHDLPLGACLYSADNQTATTQAWFCMQPAHIHAARDHLMLTDPQQLHVTPEESAALLETAMPILHEVSAQRDLSHPQRWYFGTEQLPNIQTTSPSRASGRNLDMWMPKNASAAEFANDDELDLARRWRRWQNEIQMLWFDHPVNQAREARGVLPINTVWLFGGGKVPSAPLPFSTVVMTHTPDLPWVRGLAQLSQTPYLEQRTYSPELPQGTLVIAEALCSAALQEDWSAWLTAIAELDNAWYAPALAALRNKRVQTIDIVFSSDTHWAQWRVRRQDLWKFWQKQSLTSALQNLLMEDLDA